MSGGNDYRVHIYISFVEETCNCGLVCIGIDAVFTQGILFLVLVDGLLLSMVVYVLLRQSRNCRTLCLCVVDGLGLGSLLCRSI